MSDRMERGLRILLVLKGVVHYRHFDRVVRELDARGHVVRIAIVDNTSKRNTTDRALQECVAQCMRVEVVYPSAPHTPRWQLAWRLRELVNYGTYFGPLHTSRDLSKRWRLYLPKYARRAVDASPTAERLLTSRTVVRACDALQRRLPADREIVDAVARWQPDVVVASPFIYDRSIEVEYINAAAALGIPSVVHVLSWDNLTTKGTFASRPDTVTVWNETLKREAVELHGLPAERIAVVGAPTFDYLFEMRPSLSRSEFAARSGVTGDRPFVVYLCSSTSIAKDEKQHVMDFVRAIRRNPATASVGVVVRPHPLNANIWSGFAPQDFVLWPRDGAWPDVADAQQVYFDTLHHCCAVVGVNTSAFLEAAIIDRPCITAITDTYRGTQTGRGHFAHLMNAQFIATTSTLEGAAQLVEAAIGGRDLLTRERRQFVRDFIRPRGRDTPAARVVCDLLESVCGRRATWNNRSEMPRGA